MNAEEACRLFDAFARLTQIELNNLLVDGWTRCLGVQAYSLTIVITDFRSSLFLHSLRLTYFGDTQEAEI